MNILLTDLLHLCTNLFRPPPAPRTTERKLLVIPNHEAVDKPQMQPVIAKAAEQLATSGMLWKWVSTDDSLHLVSWDAAQKIFLRGTLEDWCLYFGRNWIVKDSDGREFLGPSLPVADRLIQAILKHPAIPQASWAEQLRRKREAK